MPTIQIPHIELHLVVYRGLELRGYTPLAITTIGPVVLKGVLTFAGHAPDRARGLLLRSYEPNIAVSAPQPGVLPVTLNGKIPKSLNTSLAPIAVPTFHRRTVLEGWNPIIGISSDAFASSLQLRGNVPVSFTESPTFVPTRLPLTFTLYQPDLLNTDLNIDKAPGANSLALSGKALTYTTSDLRTAAPAEDTLVLAGQAPIASTPEAIIKAPDAAALTLSTQLPVSLASLLVKPTRVYRSLIGKIPAAVEGFSYTVAPGEETLSLSGQDTYPALGPVATPALDTLTINGQVPTTDVTTALFEFPPQAALSFSGQAASARISIIPGAETITLASSSFLIDSSEPAIDYASASTKFISLTTRYGIEPLFD